MRGHDVTLIAVGARPSMAAGTVSTRNIVTSSEQLPQCRVRRLLAGDEALMRGNGFDDTRRLGIAALDGYGGATTRLHRAFQPFDGFIDPLVVVLGIGEGLLPECVGLMQARRSAIHAPLPIWRSRPDRIFNDREAGVVNIGQVRGAIRPYERGKAPAGMTG